MARVPPKLVNGVIDLSSWSFEKDGPIKLKGEWSFFWKNFIDPKFLQENSFPDGSNLSKVPGYWTNIIKKSSQEQIKSQGYGTYLLKVKGIELNKNKDSF